MNGITIFLASVALASLVGCAQAKGLPPHLASQATNEWSAEEHRVAADLFEEEATRLEVKVGHLDKRVERFTKKPYLDTKGFRRQSARRLMGAYRLEISELREHMAWHHGEAERFNAMPPSEERETLREGKRSS